MRIPNRGPPSLHSPVSLAFDERMRYTHRQLAVADVLLPHQALADLRLQAEKLRQYPHLVVGSLRDPQTGKFVSLRGQ